MKGISVTFIVACAVAPMMPSQAWADRPGPPNPPQEAFDACAGSKEGATCTVRFHDREIAGTCAPVPGQGLACRPNAPPPPPKAAFDACSSAKQGDACTVTFGDRTLSGTCEPFPGEGLACRPTGMGPPPSRD